MSISHSTSIRTEHDDDELELPVEVVAERLGLPAAMLIRRIEAGDVPARRVEDADGSHYHVRLADLGPATSALRQPDGDDAGEGVRAQEITGTVEPLSRNGRIERDAALDASDLSAAVPPPPLRGEVELTPIDHGTQGGRGSLPLTEGPRAELAMMNLDPRELVAGLLDRWERTLEQRIYAEQRQRFESELDNRQATVKQLQLQLEAVRAEHAAALAEKDRLLAERYYELTERDRQISELRLKPKRHGWFSR